MTSVLFFSCSEKQLLSSEGQVEAAMSKNFQQPLVTLEAEAKALEESIFFAWDVSIQEAVFECDSKIVSDTVNNIDEPPITIANIILGIQQKMREFKMVQVCHVKRQENRPAHLLLVQNAKGVASYVI